MIKQLKFSLFATFMLLFLCNCSISQTIIDADNPAIVYSGRIDFSNKKAPCFGYSGVRIRTKFTGKSIKAKLASPQNINYFYVIIDSILQPKILVDQRTSEVVLAQNLKDTIHELELLKITECSQGKCIFKGFELDENKKLLKGIVPETRKIHFIGNSITCGYGIEVLDSSLHFDPATENFYDAYAAITARKLKSDYNIVARSGIGIYRNYGAPKTGSTDNMFNIYTQILHDSISPKWNMSLFQPQVVCLNLGTNDFSEQKGDATIFTTQYNTFVDSLRSYYPNSKLVLLMGPMYNAREYKEILQGVVKKHELAGDRNISMFEMSAQGELRFGADWHPSRAQARKNAAELTEYLRSITGWK